VHKGALKHEFLAYTFQSHLPYPDCLAVPTRHGVVRAASRPIPASPGSDCPQFLADCCDSQRAEVFHLYTFQWRLVAHYTRTPDLVDARNRDIAQQIRIDGMRGRSC